MLTDRNMYFLSTFYKKKIDIKSIHSIQVNKDGDLWYLNNDSSYGITFVGVYEPAQKAVLVAYTLKQYQKVAGEEN